MPTLFWKVVFASMGSNFKQMLHFLRTRRQRPLFQSPGMVRSL